MAYLPLGVTDDLGELENSRSHLFVELILSIESEPLHDKQLKLLSFPAYHYCSEGVDCETCRRFRWVNESESSSPTFLLSTSITMKRTIDCSHTLSVEIQVRNIQGVLQPFPSFATGETINGIVSIASQSDINFENVHISFIGEQSTSIPSNTPPKAHHRFLELVQPIQDSVLPTPRVLKKGREYEIPFSFQVPDYLSSSSCSHSANPLVKAAHLHVPPSCGDATVSGFGGRLRDDSAPAACKVGYTIVVKLGRPSLVTGTQEIILERKQKIRIKSHVGDVPLPDLPMGSLSSEYSLHHEETVLDSRKQPVGQLAVTLEQPDCFWHPLRDPIGFISKAVRLSLVYTTTTTTTTNPSSQSQTAIGNLPDLKSLRGQITISTIYTTSFTTPHPPPRKRDFFNRPLNFRDDDLPLSIPSLPQLRWIQAHSPETGGVYHTATILVPVTLPKDKNFVPTFHSCLISRIYSLSFQLSVQGVSTQVKLRAPMQISAERDPGALPSYNASLGVVDTDWEG
ncbi:hypothetical protein BDW59DRAFT_179727 [Aspergillus cavernicola]|uniref:Arrestin-like N-terminal domain-containing protein n=1 Tax=Aspergillus cavernicola TaxID=176166 RepID=A0ABR4IE96_9EURO